MAPLSVVPPPLDDRSDEELVRAARGGDRDAFFALVRRHQAKAVSLASRYLGSSSLAHDVAQDAFVDLHLALGRYRAEDRFLAWWHRILINRCRMAVRADRSRITMHAALEATPAEPAPRADELLIARARHLSVQRGLETLTEKLREVVVLRFTAGLPLQDIATTLELPLGTVKSRLFSGLAELRAAMNEKEKAP